MALRLRARRSALVAALVLVAALIGVPVGTAGAVPAASPGAPAGRTAAPAAASPAAGGPKQTLSEHAKQVPAQLAGHQREPVCDRAPAGHVNCMAIRDVTSGYAAATAWSGPAGYWPSDLQFAYSLPTGNGDGVTVALVDAFDAPNVQADLTAYRKQFGLPACPAGCFTKVNERGQPSPLPAFDEGWSEEITLDVEMVTAACPRCRIVLVETDSTDTGDIDLAEDTAASFHPVAISNSFGGDEVADQVTAHDPHFNHPGIAITVSAGDEGYGVQYPASSPYVIAVGGTSLRPAYGTARGYQETVWGNASSEPYGYGTGSGCSDYEPKPAWQTDTGCAHRSVADLAAVADPATGVAVYQTSSGSCAGDGGWCVFGGTSAAAPLVAGMFALAAGAAPLDYPAQSLYDSPQGLDDVTSGSNSQNYYAACPPGSYFCTARAGYDGPTGQGTPNGLSALQRRTAADGTFHPLPPHRILDTRNGLGRSAANTPLRAGEDFPVVVGGAAGVPTDATGVVLNVTVTGPSAAGYITAHPRGTAPPLASNLNFVAGQTVPNLVMVQTPGAAFSLYDYETAGGATAHLVVDVSGYYTGVGTAAGTFRAVDRPARLLDSRSGTGAPARAVTAGETVRLQVAGRGGLPSSGIGAVVLNVTVTGPTSDGYVTAYADDPTQPRPYVSNLNYTAGLTAPNLAVVPVGADGAVDLYNFENNRGTVHLVADVFGYFTAGEPSTAGALHTMVPTRALDTRTAGGAVGAGAVRRLKVTGGSIPDGVTAVIMNVTVTEPTASGYVTVFPDGQAVPTASNVNYVARQTVPNLTVVPVAANGVVDLYNFENFNGTAQLVADISGYFVPGTYVPGG